MALIITPCCGESLLHTDRHRALQALGRARVQYATIFDPSRPCSLLSDDRALYTDDSWSPEVDAVDLPPPVAGATGAGHVCIPRGSAFAGFSYLLHRGPSLSPTVHRPALRGASRWFLPRSACPNNSAWARMETGPTDELGLR